MQPLDMRRPRLLAFRCEEAKEQVLRQLPGLVLFCGCPAGIARALRQARKAARAGDAAYDPVRHAALLRLARLGTRAGVAGPGKAKPPPA